MRVFAMRVPRAPVTVIVTCVLPAEMLTWYHYGAANAAYSKAQEIVDAINQSLHPQAKEKRPLNAMDLRLAGIPLASATKQIQSLDDLKAVQDAAAEVVKAALAAYRDARSSGLPGGRPHKRQRGETLSKAAAIDATECVGPHWFHCAVSDAPECRVGTAGLPWGADGVISDSAAASSVFVEEDVVMAAGTQRSAECALPAVPLPNITLGARRGQPLRACFRASVGSNAPHV